MSSLQQAANKSFLKSSTFIFLIRSFPTLAALLVVIFFSRQIAEAQYGTYQTFWVYLYVFNALACMGIHVAFLSFDKETVAAIIRSIPIKGYLLFIGFVAIVTLVFSFFQHLVTNISFGIGAVFFFVNVLAIIFESLLIIFQRFKLLTATSIFYSVAYLIIHYLFLSNGWTLSFLFLLLLIPTFIKLLVAFSATVKSINSFPTSTINTSFRKHWLNMYVFDIFQMLFKYVDKFILTLFLSKTLFAIYFNGSIDIPFLPILLGAVSGAVLMQIATEKGHKDDIVVIATMHYSSRILSCIIFPLLFFLLFFSYELFDVVFTEKYAASVPIFTLSIFVLPVRCYAFTTILQQRQKGNIINIGAVIDLVLACALMFPLYKLMGLPGVALSFVISTYVQAAFYLHHSARLLKKSFFHLIPYRDWIKKIFISLLLVWITYVLLRLSISKNSIILLIGLMTTSVVIAALLYTEIFSTSKTSTLKK